jgi:hypothetical protein
MTDGTRVLRTLAVPLIVALVFLFLVPKTCQKAIGTRKLRLPTATATATAASDTALHIVSVSPDAPSSRPTNYPAGLDAQRARYLIEIDGHFQEPYKVLLPKPGGMVLDTAPADALVAAGWFEAAGGGYTPARGAALHLSGMTETPVAWLVPAGKRHFERITGVDDFGNGKARVAFSWQWEPNEAGRAIKTSFELHQGTAEFGGGGEHPWDLNSVTVDSEWR